MSSGATIAARCRPHSPPATRAMNSAHISAASARGRTQWAWMCASSQDGPSGSALETRSVRDGWRPASIRITAAACSPISGLRAMTTRFITLVRAATCRSGPPSTPAVVSGAAAQIRASSASIPAIVWVRDDQRRAGSAICGPSPSVTPPDAFIVRSAASGDHRAR